MGTEDLKYAMNALRDLSSEHDMGATRILSTAGRHGAYIGELFALISATVERDDVRAAAMMVPFIDIEEKLALRERLRIRMAIHRLEQ